MVVPVSAVRRNLWTLILCVVFVAACDAGRNPPSLVIMVSIDTLRADHLGCYGYPRDTSPFLDRLAAEGIVYERAFAHAPSTLPSHASLFSSLLPQHHQASHAHRRALPGAALTLAEILLGEGWATASFNGGGQLAVEYGVAQGFEVYDSLARLEDRFSRTVESGLRWLDSHEGRPRFLFLHTFEVHQPPDPPPEFLAFFAKKGGVAPEPPGQGLWEPGSFGEAELAWFVDRYDAEIRSMDAAFGELVAGLRRRRLWDQALVVFTSDHGEEFGDHGWLATHAHTLFDELLHVPLIIKLPSAHSGGRRVSIPVRLIDVAPTILSRVGIAPPRAWQGLDLETDSSVPRTLVALRDTATSAPVAAVRTADWKLVGRSLYDLGRDPGETTDVASMHSEIAQRLDLYRQRIVASGQTLKPEATEPQAATRARLQALGYVD